MTQEVIDVGVNADDGTGDSLYESGNKINNNFDDFFDRVIVKADIKFFGNNITSRLTNADIDVHPSGTGSVVFPAIRFNDNNIEVLNSNDDLKISASGSGRVVIAGLGFGGTSISSSDSASININENLIVDGDASFGGTFSFSGAQTFVTGSTFATLTFANGSITDSSGAISFGNENLTTTGTVTSGTLTMAGGSITDSSGEISFGNENLTTTGTLDVGGLSTLGALTVTGAMTFTSGGVTVDNLSFNDNIISSSSNADIRLTPGGTGAVIVNNLTIDDNINITDNHIKATASNSDLILSPSGSGSVVMSKADINSGAIDGTAIGGTTAAAGTFTTLTVVQALTLEGITIDDNTVKTNSSNANLELSGNGTGGVTISGFTFPTSDGTSGQFIKTDGSGNLSFATAGATLNNSDLADATTTVASSATSTLNQFDKTVYRSAKLFISIKDATNSRFELVEANVTHDGTNAFISTFGSTTNYTGGLCVFSADIDGDNVRVRVTNISDASTVFKLQRIAIDV